MPTTIIINTTSSLDKLYESIRASLNERYHSGGNCFANYSPTAAEQVDISTNSSYAAHASDNLHIGNTHIERLIV